MKTAGTHLWLVMMKAHRAMARHASRSIASLDMCFSDFTILELLLHRGPQPINAIGRKIDLTSGSITAAVDRLEKRGLVVRQADTEDRRAKQVMLTEEGRRKIESAFEHHQQCMDQAADGLDPSERKELIHLLKKLGLAAEKQLEDENE